VAEASQVGLRIEKDAIILQDTVAKVCSLFDIDPYESISEGTLIIACRPEQAAEVVTRLGDKGIPVAVFPTGTGNVLAKEFGLPRDPAGLCDMIARGHQRRLDVGAVNGRRFLAVVGVGFDGFVAAEVARSRRGHLGPHRYVLPVLRAVFGYRWPRLRVRVDGEARVRTARLAFASNIRNYATWFRIAPGARPDDGRLDFVLLREGGARDTPRWAFAALTGTLAGLRETRCVRGRSLEVDSDAPVPFQVDGDPGGVTPITVSMLDDALEVIVP